MRSSMIKAERYAGAAKAHRQVFRLTAFIPGYQPVASPSQRAIRPSSGATTRRITLAPSICCRTGNQKPSKGTYIELNEAAPCIRRKEPGTRRNLPARQDAIFSRQGFPYLPLNDTSFQNADSAHGTSTSLPVLNSVTPLLPQQEIHALSRA